MKGRRAPLVTETSQAGIFSRRALVVGGAQATLAALLAGRMGYIAIAQNQRYTTMAEDNRVQERLIAPRRGWIVDRYGQPIAVNRSDYRVDIIPDRLEDKARVLAELTRLLGLTPEDVTRLSEEIDRVAGYQPVPVAESLTFDQFAAVELRRPELPGVSPLRSFSRYYPEGAAVGHLVGYVGAPSREEYEAEPADKRELLLAPGFKIGKAGLEKEEEMRLRGRPGAVRTEVTARGRPVRDLSTRPDVSGPPLHTTIDAGLQSYAARRAGDQSVGSVVLDIHTGDILAFVSMPSYDPNSFSDGIGQTEWAMMSQDERHPLINKVLQGLYPPGSTCKPMNALALLEAGVDPNATVTCNRAYRVGNHIFHCDTTHGTLSMADAVIKSCDIYFYHMALQVGIEKLTPIWRAMGIGNRFELPFPHQRPGTVPDPAWLRRREDRDWQGYDTVNCSIGQGYLLSNPMQQAIMTARLASGRSVLPRLLTTDPIHAGDPLPFNPDHVAFIRAAMDGVVNSGRGTASGARLPVEGVTMGGKTGTAQVRRISMSERAGGVLQSESLSWRMRDHSHFVAFAPVANPRYACACLVEHGGWGASAAAPFVRDVMTYLFDKDKAMEALLPMEAQWGGNIAERMERHQREWVERGGGSPHTERA
jgi:penicillin-binding protein 2